MAINCPNFPNARKKEKFDAAELTDLRLRIKEHEKLKRKARQTSAYQQTQSAKAALRQSFQNEWTRVTANLVSLSPEMLPRLLDFMVAQFGIKQKGVLSWIPGDYSVAGNVRRVLVSSRKAAENIILLEGRINSIAAIRKLEDAFKGRKLDKHVLAELIDDTLTTGQIPVERSLYNMYRSKIGKGNTMYDQFADMQYQSYRDRMSTAGFADDEIDNILTLAVDVATAFDRTAMAARSQGVAIKELTDTGYVPRLYTDEVKMRLRDINDQTMLEPFINQGGVDFSTIHSMSRNTFHYIPIDSDMAASVLRIDVADIDDMLADPLEWVRFLQENVSNDQLDMLVDAGVMGKLPMSSREVFDWFKRQYAMPYTYLDEVVQTDMSLLFNKYTESLMQSAGTSSLINVLVSTEARNSGWVVTSEMYENNKTLYSNFVPIGDAFERLSGMNNMTISQMATTLGVPLEAVKALRNARVHPIVAKQWSAIMAVSVNPAALNTLAGMALRAGRWVNKRVLTNVQYVLRNTLSSVINNTAAGGSYLSLPQSVIELERVMAHGLDVLDDTKRIWELDGRTYTMRGMMHEFLLREGASSVPGTVSERVAATPRKVPITGLVIPPIVTNALRNPSAVRRAYSYLIDYAMAHGDAVNGRRLTHSERVGRLSKAAFAHVNELLDDAYTPYATYAVLSETAAKWNVWKTVAKKINRADDVVDMVQQVVTSGQVRRFDKAEDVSRHLNDYFVDPFDVGRTTAFINNYVRPFATWAMANPTMQLRHTLRNPHLYLAYQRLRAIVNQPVDDDEKANQYTIPGWIQEGLPVYIGRNPDGAPYVLLPGNYDGATDAFSFFQEAGEDVARLAFGAKVGTPEEINAQLRGETTSDFFAKLASMMHVPYKVVLEQIMNKETFSGRVIEQREIDQSRSLLGVRVNGRLAHVVENFMPLVRQFDALNPFGWWGVAPSRDIYGNIIDQGKLSVFGAERTRSDEFLAQASEDFIMRSLRIAGLQIRTLNYDRQYYRSVADLDRTLNDISRAYSNGRDELRSDSAGLSGAVSTPEYQRRVQVLNELAHSWTQLSIDKYRLELWANQQGLPTSDALEKLNNLRLNLRSLPLPPGATLQTEVFDRLNNELPFLEDVLKESLRQSR